jgi:predicted amidophosphoribosyltransferase
VNDAGDERDGGMDGVPEPKNVCPNCQSEVRDEDENCPTCGFDLAGARTRQDDEPG